MLSNICTQSTSVQVNTRLRGMAKMSLKLNYLIVHYIYIWWSAIPDSAVAEPRHTMSHIPSQTLVHMFLDQLLTVSHRIFNVYNMYSSK
jgi:hypothetical protein